MSFIMAHAVRVVAHNEVYMRLLNDLLRYRFSFSFNSLKNIKISEDLFSEGMVRDKRATDKFELKTKKIRLSH